MREILFRAKETFNGEWVEGYYEFGYDAETEEPTHYMWVLNHTEKYGDMFMVIPETVGQYTGLTDKNGKKIFEGDIVLFEDESPTNYEYHDSTEMRCGEVKFDWGSYYLTNRIAVEMDDLIYDEKLDGEVIGNIHDNPELLKYESEGGE